MINVALIGVGAHSTGNHAPALQHFVSEHPDRARLAAVCDLDPARAEAACAKFGFDRAVTSLDALHAERLDALVAVLPIPVMLAAMPDLLAFRLPLLIEKPLGQNLQEAAALVQAVKDAGMEERVMVSLNRRFTPSVTRARAWLRKQAPFRYLRASMVRHHRTEPDFVWGTGIHLIDLVQYIAGPLTLDDAVCPGNYSDQARLAIPARARQG